MNTDLKPEDFWSGAEKLLDNHYKAKRRRKAALWIISVLTIAGSLIYLTSNENVRSVVSEKNNNKSIPEKNVPSSQENKIQPESNSENNSPSIKESEKYSPNNAIEKSPVLSDPMISGNEQNNSVSGKSEEVKTKKSSISNISQTINTTSENRSNAEANATLKVQTSDKINGNVGNFKDEKVIPSPDVSEQSENKSIKNSDKVISTSGAFSPLKNEDQQIHSLLTRNSTQFKLLETTKHINSSRGEEIKQPKAKYPAEYRIEVLAGLNQISKSFSGFENVIVEHRRNSWETEVIYPQMGVAVSRTTAHFSTSLGLNYIQYGEKVNYDPGVKSLFLVDNSYWNTYLTNVLITDTNYVFGYVYLTQQTIQRLDSNFIQQTDSMEQIVINNNIVKSTGTNIISYVEMPFTLSYYFGNKKFKYGVSAGVSAGMLVYSKGYYLNNAGNDVVNISDPELFKKIIFNGQLGVELKYCLSPGIHFLLRPKYQMNLNSIVKDDAGFKQRYSGVGVGFGVSFMLK